MSIKVYMNSYSINILDLIEQFSNNYECMYSKRARSGLVKFSQFPLNNKIWYEFWSCHVGILHILSWSIIIQTMTREIRINCLIKLKKDIMKTSILITSDANHFLLTILILRSSDSFVHDHICIHTYRSW